MLESCLMIKNEEKSEHHFIVRYTEQEGWVWDTETENARFGRCIYLPTTEAWVNSSYSEEINRIDTEASEQLGKLIHTMNGEKC